MNDREKAWQKFKKSGKIKDYLEYRGFKEEES